MTSVADVAVVGAGPAGLFAAKFAAERGLRVVVLEKNRRPGLKILISGGGRCNLTTTLGGQELEAQYGARRGRFLRHALRAFPPPALRAAFEAQGVALHEEDLDKIFPVSRRASDVLDALLRMVATAGAEIRGESAMLDVERRGDRFAVHTANGDVFARKVILSTGGLSYPKTGATGDGYPVCARLGHRVVDPVPALAPLALDTPWVHALQGIVLPAPRLSLRGRGGEVLVQRQRPVLFTHRGLSGPAPMDVSGCVEEQHGGCVVELDLVPERTAEQLDAQLLAAARRDGRGAVAHALPSELPERLRRQLVALAQAEGPLSALTRAARQQLVALLKSARLPVERSLGFAHAEVTRGGVELDEVDPRTMKSRIVPGLHLCGEIIDIDGPIGGFNFQAAFATGRLAGLAV